MNTLRPIAFRSLVPVLASLVVSLALPFSASPAAAQDSAAPAMPKIIQLQREWIKPGKGGVMHDKSEAAFVQAMTKAKFPAHYIALNAMSGKSRALYLSPYPSFEAWEKDNQLVEKNATLAAEIDHAAAADGELLDGYDQSLLTYSEELSYKPKPDIGHAHYLEITIFHIRPGHRMDFIQATKLVKDAHDKAGTSAHWATYEIAYGAEAGTYIAFSSDHALSEIDHGYSEEPKWIAAMGEDGMKKLEELSASGIESMRSELFSINPKQSYVDDAWIKADPDFWQPK